MVSRTEQVVELWGLTRLIPIKVLKELNHTEERLKPFYEDLETQMIKLKKEFFGK